MCVYFQLFFNDYFIFSKNSLCFLSASTTASNETQERNENEISLCMFFRRVSLPLIVPNGTFASVNNSDGCINVDNFSLT